ncbi:DUF2252 domain-containing protein [Zavarzinella formosa]|uniref:DUF2252 domain-containing protein n=1 Tax=Zavarzinella formosa TaxID=360055 RepID=UPI0002EE8445|nr:DUF2252 domain-containing protein [Zavarzinella formosa]
MKKKAPPEVRSFEERQAALTDLRNQKMARSAHAYVRGNTQQFYEWLATTGGRSTPKGPPVWICGDCHLGNLGPIASAKGKIDIQIRDLDQTVIGNPAHDLIRLGLSLATAARGSDLPGVTTVKMLEQVTEGYAQSFLQASDTGGGETEQPEAVRWAMREALNRKWKHLARERIRDTTPTIPLGKNFWPLSESEKKQIHALFETEQLRRLVTALGSRDADAPVEALDAAYWVKGCSSLGRLRYAVLLRVGGKKGELCLIDIKEAVKPSAPRHLKARMPRDNGERVVQGAWHLSPSLGDRMLAAKLDGHSVFLRELLPQDLKFDIENLSREEALKVARFLATVLGKAHARQMDETGRKKWQSEMSRNHSKTMDAPHWLWSSVVELVASHEGGYLEHCRKYAMAGGV